MSVLAGTAPATTWYLSRSASAALFSGLSRFVRVPLGRAANASFVGANTVKGPLPENVSTSPAALTAVTSVERSGVATAVSTIVLLANDISVQPRIGKGWAESVAS